MTKFYLVGNEYYVVDYFAHKDNAEKAKDRVNQLCNEYKDNPKVNTTPVFVHEIQTAD